MDIAKQDPVTGIALMPPVVRPDAVMGTVLQFEAVRSFSFQK